MALDERAIMAQYRELHKQSDNVYMVRRKLKAYQAQMNTSWIGEEMRIINDAIDDLNRKLNRIREDMNDLSKDMLKSYEQLRDEEIMQQLSGEGSGENHV